MSQWVRHISGQGEKWEVADDHPSWMTPDAYPNPNIEWLVYGKQRGRFAQHLLPKSEYILCDPPEQWVDVTKSLDLTDDGSEASERTEKVWAVQCLNSKYRLRRIAMNELSCRLHSWAFIVERKEP